MVAKAIKHWCVGGQNSKIVRRPCVWRDLSNLWYPIHCQTSETDAKKLRFFFWMNNCIYATYTIWWCPKNTLMLELIMEMHGTEGHFESKKVLKCTFLCFFFQIVAVHCENVNNCQSLQLVKNLRKKLLIAYIWFQIVSCRIGS